ncbi:STAS domain-containing protein [Streptomyces olivaceiscleroticus]|uniref:STAS domain-containing protein n=1 Tax=Streptomyces olivaceiscleroticus TaxID=68245 RepID=A0ABN1A369_9ACTN
MDTSHPATTLLRAQWTTRPPGLRLTGAIEPASHAALERHLADLLSRFPGRRAVHIDLTGVHSLDLVGTALLIATRNVLRRHDRDLHLRLPAGWTGTFGGAP